MRVNRIFCFLLVAFIQTVFYMLDIQQEKIIPELTSLRVYGSDESQCKYYYVSTLPKVAKDNSSYRFFFAV